MSQRNPQTSIKTGKIFGQKTSKISNVPGSQTDKSAAAPILCPSCKTEVHPRPGFRLSALKCPKCGASMGGK